MLSQKGQTTNSRVNTSDTEKGYSPSETEFLEFILSQGTHNLSQSLKRIHDMALYHSNLPLEDEERTALYHLKILWEELEKI